MSLIRNMEEKENEISTLTLEKYNELVEDVKRFLKDKDLNINLKSQLTELLENEFQVNLSSKIINYVAGKVIADLKESQTTTIKLKIGLIKEVESILKKKLSIDSFSYADTVRTVLRNFIIKNKELES